MVQGALKVQAEMDATKSIVSMAKKAQDLYVQQQQIEKQVQQRYVASNSSHNATCSRSQQSGITLKGHELL